jgi:hypothetical protein
MLLLLLLQATHLIIGTMGVLDVPSEFESSEPVRMDFDFTQHAKWGEYWSKMQVRRWGPQQDRQHAQTKQTGQTASGDSFWLFVV